MFSVIHILLLGLYALTPVVTFAWALRRRRQGNAGPLVTTILIYVGGLGIGVGVLIINTKLMGGRIPTEEAIRLVYFTIAAMCLLWLVDRLLLQAAFRAGRIKVNRFGQPLLPHRPKVLLTLFLQRVAMVLIVVPYVIGLLLTYRPKVVHDGVDPSLLKLAFSNARFRAADGVELAGWWIDARERPSVLDEELDPQWSRRTVLICHGIGAAKEHELGLAWLLSQRGFNVLVFDFRGHGHSGGNFISYGDRERLDVLAAVRWIRENRPALAQRIYGIGLNTGAAALVAAAADPADGQYLDALVLYEPYARFDSLARDTARRALPGVLHWLVSNVSLPVASLHAASNLPGFSPADYADSLWPRPVLIIHGRGETFIPVEQEMDFYQSIPQPKEEFWPADNYIAWRARHRGEAENGDAVTLVRMFREWLGTRYNVSSDAAVQYHTLRFLREARPVPVL